VKIQRTIHEGEMIPIGYGYVRYDFMRDAYVLAPMPINWIIRWTRNFLYWARQKSYVPLTDEERWERARTQAVIEQRMYAEGIERYNAGYEKGLTAGWGLAHKAMLDRLDKEREEERVWPGDPEDGMP
jgi:hypothetical protein